MTGAVDRGDDDIPEQHKCHGRRDYKVSNLLQASGEAQAKSLCNLGCCAALTRHGRQLCRGYGHAEKAHWERVERLRIAERGNSTSAEKAAEPCVDIRADL